MDIRAATRINHKRLKKVGGDRDTVYILADFEAKLKY